jgi:hypothetical protein
MDERWAPVLLLTPFVVLVGGYLLAWKAKRSIMRAIGAFFVAMLAGLAALPGTMGAIRLVTNYRFSWADLREAWPFLLLAGIVIFGAWYISLHFLAIAIRQFREKRSL